MPKGNATIYAQCRLEAGCTQEQWAERLEISVESVKAYELQLRIPPHYIVLRMIEASGSQSLAIRHLQETAGCLDVLPLVDVKPLPMAAIALINKILAFADQHRDRELLRIAEDGVIDEDERPIYEEIVNDLSALIGAAYQVKYAQEVCYANQ